VQPKWFNGDHWQAEMHDPGMGGHAGGMASQLLALRDGDNLVDVDIPLFGRDLTGD